MPRRQIRCASVSPSCTLAQTLADQLNATPLKELESVLGPVVRHLLREGCADCGKVLSQITDIVPDPLPDVADPRKKVVDPEAREVASRIATKLVDLPNGQRTMYLSSSHSATTRPVVEALITHSRSHLSSKPERAVEIAELAVFCADNTPFRDDEYEEAHDFDLIAEALAALATAHRRNANLRSAASSIEEAEAAVTLGSCDPVTVTAVLKNRALLERDQGRLDAAIASLDEAAEFSQTEELSHEHSKVLYERSVVLSRLERHTEAIANLHSALFHADLEREPRMGYVITLGLALRSEAADRLDDALGYLKEVIRDWSDTMNPGDVVRVIWTRGRVHAALGDLDAATADFACARDDFVSLGNYLSAASVSLELSAVLAQLGRFRAVRELAAEMLAIFRAVEVPREAMAAVYLLSQARSAEAVQEASAAFTRLSQEGRSSSGRG